MSDGRWGAIRVESGLAWRMAPPCVGLGLPSVFSAPWRPDFIVLTWFLWRDNPCYHKKNEALLPRARALLSECACSQIHWTASTNGPACNETGHPDRKPYAAWSSWGSWARTPQNTRAGKPRQRPPAWQAGASTKSAIRRQPQKSNKIES